MYTHCTPRVHCLCAHLLRAAVAAKLMFRASMAERAAVEAYGWSTEAAMSFYEVDMMPHYRHQMPLWWLSDVLAS
jgi:hypothetical protein